MVVIEVQTQKQFQDNIMGQNDTHTKQFVIVDFCACWCGPCKRFYPTYTELSEKYGDNIQFLKIDIEKVPEVAEKYNVSALPSFMIFNTGTEESNYQTIVGASKKTVEDKLILLGKTPIITEDF